MKWDKMGQIGGRGLMSNGGVLVRSVGAKRRCEVRRPLNWVCRIEEKHRGPCITLDSFATPGSRPRKSELSKSHGGCPRVPRAQTRRGVRAYLAKSFPKLSSVPR